MPKTHQDWNDIYDEIVLSTEQDEVEDIAEVIIAQVVTSCPEDIAADLVDALAPWATPVGHVSEPTQVDNALEVCETFSGYSLENGWATS